MMGLILVVFGWQSIALAQPVVTSAGPDKVGVTIYRNPNRSTDSAMELSYLGGFALISETRTVDLPPGKVTIRFEGVASGIVPQSALVFGAAVSEKNRDAALLSERGLVDAFTGQQVVIRRRDPAKGTYSEEPGTLRSGTSGIVVQTARGIEPLYCSRLENDLIFPNAPANLSAKPTLSVTTKDQAGGRRTITLVYLSQRFDWQANYVGEFSADATELNLFAWLTMASSDDTSFVNATAAAVAGKVNRNDDGTGYYEPYEPPFNRRYDCWPRREYFPSEPVPPPPPPAPPVMLEMASPVSAVSADIVVAGAKRMRAQREDLGDLKLYRIPVPVTVAANGQKQVAFLEKPRVKGAVLYRVRYYDGLESPQMLFRFKNNAANGLGEPLPAGKVALFQRGAGERLLVGESSMADKANDEEVDLVFGSASNVTVEHSDNEATGKNWQDQKLTVRNANPRPIRFEAEFPAANDGTIFGQFTGKLVTRPGKRVWAVTVPANGTMKLGWRETEQQ